MRKFSLLIFNTLLFVQYVQADPVASRELIRQWVKTEHLISEEAADWKADKQRMQDLLDIYKKELELLNKELSATAALGGAAVTNNTESYEEVRVVVAYAVATLKPRLVRLAGRFPTPLMDEVKPALEILRPDDAQPRASLKAMISVLNAAEAFNRKTTLSEETRESEGGKKMVVDVVYLGLCRAYYVTTSGNIAGVGTPSAGRTGGWVWSSDPSIAAEVRRMISIYKKETQPDLIKLPVQILTVKAQ